MIGMQTIAELAGVSVSTVSNVINGRKNVSQATRERILQLCEEHGYTREPVDKEVRTPKADPILFIFSDFYQNFYLKIIEGISDYITENGYDLVICTNKSSAAFMRSSFTSGIILLDGSLSDDYLLSVAKPNLPILLMDRIIDRPGVNMKSVVVDNYTIMCRLVQLLVDRGFQEFGFIGGLNFTLDHKERYGGLVDTLTQNGLSFHKELYFVGDYRENSGYQAAKLMILGNHLPQVVVCANDNMAIGAIRAFREHGIRVPEDIAITGFDDSESAEIAGLTTIAIPRYENGYLAARELLAMIKGSASQETLKISASIKWRHTVK